MNIAVTMQVRFNPEDIQFKTMKTMDRAARLAMMPDYEMYCVDLKEGALVELSNTIVIYIIIRINV